MCFRRVRCTTRILHWNREEGRSLPQIDLDSSGNTVGTGCLVSSSLRDTEDFDPFLRYVQPGLYELDPRVGETTLFRVWSGPTHRGQVSSRLETQRSFVVGGLYPRL